MNQYIKFFPFLIFILHIRNISTFSFNSITEIRNQFLSYKIGMQDLLFYNQYDIIITSQLISANLKAQPQIKTNISHKQSIIEQLSLRISNHNYYQWSTQTYENNTQLANQYPPWYLKVERVSEIGLNWIYQLKFPSGQKISSCQRQNILQIIIIMMIIIGYFLIAPKSFSSRYIQQLKNSTYFLSIIINLQNLTYIFLTLTTFLFKIFIYSYKSMKNTVQILRKECQVSLSSLNLYLMVLLFLLTIGIIVSRMWNNCKIIIKRVQLHNQLSIANRILIFIVTIVLTVIGFCLFSAFFYKGIMFYMFWGSFGIIGHYLVNIEDIFCANRHCFSKIFNKNSKKQYKVLFSMEYIIQSHFYLLTLVCLNMFYPLLHFQQTNLSILIVLLMQLISLNIIPLIVVKMCPKKIKQIQQPSTTIEANDDLKPQSDTQINLNNARVNQQ